MDAKNVLPQKWTWDEHRQFLILFDDGEYSVIWGKYEGVKALGTRWNGETDIGYPNQGAYPTWYVEPDFIAIAILQRLLTLAIDNGDKNYLENIKIAINELSNKMTLKE